MLGSAEDALQETLSLAFVTALVPYKQRFLISVQTNSGYSAGRAAINDSTDGMARARDGHRGSDGSRDHRVFSSARRH
ncbi:hypothetical protein [Nonomuraea sp. NPDC049784]|uniref:hypothetical protein n=1 Tax=Nonomuraea sp. NPDC049784 TaxID=3154361 RepID=UPI003408AD27